MTLDPSDLPPLLAPFNKRPILLRETGTVHRGPRYIEIDINTQNLNVVAGLAQQGPQSLFAKVGDMDLQLGLVVEGRAEHELPETLCCCIGLNKLPEAVFVDLGAVTG
jgi:hypothetical protein